MSANSRLTVALHIMSLLARRQLRSADWFTSEQIATSVNTNPVFIRRILGILKKANLVQVRQGGHQSGWKLNRSAEDISLLEIFNAVELKPLFDLHHSEPNPECAVAKGIQPVLLNLYGDAEMAMKQEFAKRTLADLLRQSLAEIR